MLDSTNAWAYARKGLIFAFLALRTATAPVPWSGISASAVPFGARSFTNFSIAAAIFAASSFG